MKAKYFRIFWFILFFHFSSQQLCAQEITFIQGNVKDSLTGEPIPFVNIYFQGKNIGTMSDEKGNFTLKSRSGTDKVSFSAVGYHAKTLPVKKEENNKINISLNAVDYQLSEVVVKPQKGKYKKKENPAVELMEKVIRNKEKNDIRSFSYYSASKYEKVVLGISGFHEGLKEKRIFRSMNFLFESIDTSEISQRPFLPVAVRENISDIYYRSSPESFKQFIRGERNSGLDNLFSDEAIANVVGEVFSDVQIYDNNIKLLLTRLVSPISSAGPSFYKYYLIDTVEMENVKYTLMSFVPFNPMDFGFTGMLYITQDSCYAVKKLELSVPRNTKINLLEELKIIQEFEKQENGAWALCKDQTIAELQLLKNMQGLYAKRVTYYKNHSSEEPDRGVFDHKKDVIRIRKANVQQDSFWLVNRIDTLKSKEKKVDNLYEELNAYWGFRIAFFIVKSLIEGYISVGDPPIVDIGPVNTFITGNYLEGFKLGVGGQTAPRLHDRWFFAGNVAYGFKDKKLKYKAELEYSFLPKEISRNEYPRRSLILSYTFDSDTPGERFLKTNKDNVFVGWKRVTVDQMSYLRNVQLESIVELDRGLNFYITAKQQTETPAGKLEYILNDSDQTEVKDITTTSVNLLFRYAPGERFYLSKNYRYSLTKDKPVFTLSHTIGLKGLFRGDYNYNITEVSYGQRYFLTPYGQIDLFVKAGKVWNKVPFPVLFMPAANLSYLIQPETFWLMNNMEFINDQYISLDFSYNLNGWLFSRIPLIKKLKWREVVRFRALYGHLSDKNNPAKNPNDGYLFYLPYKDSMPTSFAMKNVPYMEVSVGIHNIFKLIQIEYVRRLNYLDYPNADKWGIRFALGFSF